MSTDIEKLRQEADALFRRGNWPQARQLYQVILELDPQNAPAMNRIGATLAEEGNLPAAETYFKRALDLDPTLAPAWSNLGNIHYSRRQWSEAVACYRRAIELDPDYPTAYNNLAAAYKKMGRVADAVAELKKAQRLQLRNVVNSAEIPSPGERRQPPREKETVEKELPANETGKGSPVWPRFWRWWRKKDGRTEGH